MRDHKYEDKKNPRFNFFCSCSVWCPQGSLHTSGFLIVNIQHRGASAVLFRAESVTVNTPHTTGKSNKIIFRTTSIIETLPRIVGRGEIGPKSPRLSCGVYPALVDMSHTAINRKIKQNRNKTSNSELLLGQTLRYHIQTIYTACQYLTVLSRDWQ